MITFKRTGTNLYAEVDTGSGVERPIFPFSFANGGNEASASVMTQHLRDRMFSKLQAIREEAYEQGWSEGRAKKRPKRTWFRGTWS